MSSFYNEIEELFAQATACNRLIISAFHASHAKEIECFLQHRTKIEEGMGALLHFQCEFYDPYFTEDIIEQSVYKLGGSYLDSCVNALSVINKLIGLPNMKCVDFSESLLSADTFSSITNYTNGDITGKIMTNWCNNQNYKCTTLFYEKGRAILCHSNQTITIKNGMKIYEVECSENRPRLVNHYIGVQKEIIALYNNHHQNKLEAQLIHRLLLKGYAN